MSLSKRPVFLELLEARIAPAVINAGPTDIGGVPTGAQSYNSPGTSFQAASNAPVEGGDPVIFNAGDVNHYVLDLKSGDTLRMFSASSSFTDFVKVTSGRAYAFFFDKNTNGIPEANELSGLVLSTAASVSVSGDVDGSILSTMNATTGTYSTNGLTNGGVVMSVSGLKVSGNVGQLNAGVLTFGHIVAGGGLTNISAGQINNLQSGTPAVYDPLFPATIFAPLDYDLGGTGAGAVGQGTLAVYTPAPGIAGGSISNVTLNSADLILAGPGHVGGGGVAGTVGGSITNVKILADGNGLVIGAGAGGDSTGAVGGNGGAVTQVVVSGVTDSNSNLINIYGGVGGDSLTGRGGIGGRADNIWVGYQYNSSNQIVASENVLLNRLVIRGGDGGSGILAGAGGALTAINVIASPDDAVGPDAEIRLLGGDGGDLLANSTTAGLGGSISNFKIQNLDADGGVGNSHVLVHAGDASDSSALLPGQAARFAVGGSITNVVPKGGSSTPGLIGQSFEFRAGNGYGSLGLDRGGAGGSISNLGFSSFANQFLEDLTVIAGAGGTNPLGVGGAGGSIAGVTVPISELSSLLFQAGKGGSGGAGAGGVGGSVSRVDIFDFNVALAPIAVQVLAGSGGDGTRSGGVGGGITTFSYFGKGATLVATAGNGGNSSATGGNGGSLSGVAFSARDLPLATATLTAGTGGNSTGVGRGGLGGSISNGNIQVTGDVEFKAGNGGKAGTGGAVGIGGSLGGSTSTLGIFAQSSGGSVKFLAGNAGEPIFIGAVPKTGAAGGSITNAVASAANNIEFKAGQGQGAGAGGSISRIGFYGDAGSSSLYGGNLTVAAGNGGNPFSASLAGGNGGGITSAVGVGSSNAAATVIFQAGNGGGQTGASGTRGGIGGTINGVTINDGAANLSVVAGNGGLGLAGGAGGGLLNVAVLPDVRVNVVAAGDGGNANGASGRAGAGGSVVKVDVTGDIGVRSGQDYGFATDGTKMGGLFAGGGGINTLAPLNTALAGINGNVTNVTAKAISAIVAGRGNSPLLVGTVDGVFLRGNTAATVDVAGGFTNFGTANLVGGKANAATGAAGADDYNYVGGQYANSDTSSNAWAYGTQQAKDGLIAAAVLTTRRNFMPLAFLTNTAGRGLPPNYQLFANTVPLA